MLIITTHKLNAIPLSNLSVVVFWGVGERLKTDVLALSAGIKQYDTLNIHFILHL